MKLTRTKALLGYSLVTATVALILGDNSNRPTKDQDIARTTAMITRLDGKSGGTGVIISSSSTESKVLTNAHVCGVVVHGGIVTTDTKRSFVSSYQVSKLHDLCLITVNSDLGLNTTVAKTSPTLYGLAIVSGHPSLLPTLITKGIFSHKDIITVMTGMKPCTSEDLAGPNAILCLLVGGIPIIHSYEAQVTSATIMPGSSGSAVFNSSGEIAGLIFAGSGALSYGWLVPQEYVYNFIKNEVLTINSVKPILDVTVSLQENSSKNRLKQACLRVRMGLETDEVIKSYCSIAALDLIFERE
jgi:S1-C subfamily serine protease